MSSPLPPRRTQGMPPNWPSSMPPSKPQGRPPWLVPLLAIALPLAALPVLTFVAFFVSRNKHNNRPFAEPPRPRVAAAPAAPGAGVVPPAAPHGTFQYQPGDEVVVIDVGHGIREGGRSVYQTSLGEVLIVREVRGNQVLVSSGHPGWMPANDLLPLSEGLAYFDRQVALHPDFDEYYVARAVLKEYLGDFDSALADYDQAIAIRDDVTWHHSRALLYTAMGQFEDSLAEFDYCIESGLQSANTHGGRGYALRHLERYDEAIADFDIAIDTDPLNAYPYASRGYCYEVLGDYQQALDDYTKAVELDDGDVDNRVTLAWLLATSPDFTIRDGQLALEHATAACELNGWQHPLVLHVLAAAHAELGDYAQAATYEQQALALDVDDFYHDALQEALEYYQEESPDDEPSLDTAEAASSTE